MTVAATVQKPRKKPSKKGRQAKKRVLPSLMQWRLYVVLFGVFVVFASLASRTAYIQVIKPDFLIVLINK